MQMSFFSILMMLFAGGGAGNDLLDAVPSKAYWKANNTEFTVEALTAVLGDPQEPGATDSVRRQMALRGLGELKAKSDAALGMIKTYTRSPDPFLSSYANAATAAIKGEPYTRPIASEDDLRTDLACMPSGLGAIGRMTLAPGAPMDLAAELKKLDMPDMPDAEQMEQQLVGGISSVAAQLGNIRINAATFGVAAEVGNDSGFAIFLVRGLYDSKALGKMLGDRIGGVRKKMGGLTYHELDSDTLYLAPVSDELLVFATGASRDLIPLAEVGEKIVGGGGDFAIGKELAQLLDKADTDSPLWALAQVTESYAIAPFFAPFDTLQLGSKPAGDKSVITLQANGTDTDAAAVAVAMVNDGLTEMRAGAAEAAKAGGVPKSMVDMLTSIKVAGDGSGSATLTAEAGSDGAMAMLPMMFLAGRSVDVPAEPQAVDELRAPEQKEAEPEAVE